LIPRTKMNQYAKYPSQRSVQKLSFGHRQTGQGKFETDVLSLCHATNLLVITYNNYCIRVKLHAFRRVYVYRESEVSHSSLDVERVAVPRTHNPRLSIALLDVTFVQRTSCVSHHAHNAPIQRRQRRPFVIGLHFPLLGPFYRAIAVPSVTRCRCCRRGHRTPPAL